MNYIYMFLNTWLGINIVLLVLTFGLAVTRIEQAEVIAPIFLVFASGWIIMIAVIGLLTFIRRRL